MEYDLGTFTRTLKELLYNEMPFDRDNEHPHANRNFHMRDLALGQNNVIPVGLNSMYFEIGNDIAEEKAPYYHILEDAQVIRKAGFGTKKSKGSQAFVQDKSKRDYGQATFTITNNSKGRRINPYYEYRRNVRGKRSLVEKSTHRVYDENGKLTKVNRDSKYYFNIHYNYIERNLEWLTKLLADEFGMQLKRVKTDFTEEYAEQNDKKYMLDQTYFDDEDF